MKLIDQVPILRVEVIFWLVALMLLSFAASVVQMIFYGAAVITDKTQLYRLVIVLAIGMGFLVCKSDLMLHQLGAYIRVVQENEAVKGSIPYWDSWRTLLKWRVPLTILIDVGAGLPSLYCAAASSMVVWRRGGWLFVVLSWLGILGSIWTVQLTVKYAGK